MTPKIDYAALGEAISAYENLGYTYVETPWVVPERIIRATLPPQFGYLELAMQDSVSDARSCDCRPVKSYTSRGGVVGSAEQGFLALGLPAGKYVGCGPCFRDEPASDLFHRPYFMKVELFVTEDGASVDDVLADARGVLDTMTDYKLESVKTADGWDLELAGIEIGSYGERISPAHGRWVYGTGLALPRFDVANALAAVI
jgi:hypothetical protein